MKKTKIIYIFLSFLTFILISLHINCVLQNYYFSYSEKYGMLSYSTFIKDTTDEIDLHTLLYEENLDSTLLLIKDEKPAVIGVYDPHNMYYMHSNNTQIPELFRYFSKQDYQNKKAVAICVNGYSSGNNSDYEKIAKKYGFDEVINTLEYTKFSYPVRFIQNIFSMKYNEGDQLYVYGENTNSVKDILIENGFTELKEHLNLNIFEAFKNIEYSYFITLKIQLYCVIILVLLCTSLTYCCVKMDMDRFIVEKKYGSTDLKVYMNHCKMMGIFYILSICYYPLFNMIYTTHIYTSFVNYMLELSIYTVAFILVYIIFFKLHYKRNMNKEAM